MTTESNIEAGQAKPAEKSRLFIVLIGVVVVLIIVGVFALLQHREQYSALAKETEKLAVPTVSVTHPIVEPSEENLVLPSTLQA